MIVFIEPVSKNTGMYVPAYPLPLMEIASFVKAEKSNIDIEVISISVDYGLPLTKEGRDKIYEELIKDLLEMKPRGIGISCTAISQAEETIYLCEYIKRHNPEFFIFLGGYFPTIYYEEIFCRTSAVDLIVIGEGEIPALKIVEHLEKGQDPRCKDIPNLSWKQDEEIIFTEQGVRFDLKNKAILNLDLLRYPRAYDVLPYSFSRGCPYNCNFCMESYIRPIRREVPFDIVQDDLKNLAQSGNANTLIVCDALFKSYDIAPLLRDLGMKMNFETRCDVLDPSILPEIADVCGMLVLGFESASYDTLKRMNKVKDKFHYEKYIAGAKTIFREATKQGIPVTVFMIAGYPGDSESDLEESLSFVKELSKADGSGGYIFKIGECHVYPNTDIHKLAQSLPDVVFDDDGVFGQNVVRQPSNNLDFDTILKYTQAIYSLSNNTSTLQEAFLSMMPFFRLPVQALQDEMIPLTCFKDKQRDIFEVQSESFSIFRKLVPELSEKYREWKHKDRITRILSF